MNKNLIGINTNFGQVVTGYSNHIIERTFGVRHDASRNDLLRKGVGTDHIKSLLLNGTCTQDKNGVVKYQDNKAYVLVNGQGNMITVIPHTKKIKKKK